MGTAVIIARYDHHHRAVFRSTDLDEVARAVAAQPQPNELAVFAVLAGQGSRELTGPEREQLDRLVAKHAQAWTHTHAWEHG